MNDIVLIIPYFSQGKGTFPSYFDFWLKSAENNADFADFLIFTDIKTQYNFPKNVNVVYCTFNDVKKKIKALFDFDIELNTPYKLCDYKVTYGLAFQDCISSYKWWGYCDIDLIFGKLSNFITDKMLCDYDKLFERGHLTLFRNTQDINNVFKEKIDNLINYHEVFTNPKSFAFDETNGISKIFDKLLIPQYKEMPFADIDLRYKCFYTTRDSKNKIIVEYKDNKLFKKFKDGSRVEILYAHFQKRNLQVVTEKKDNFKVQQNRIVPFEEKDSFGIKVLSEWYFKNLIKKIIGK